MNSRKGSDMEIVKMPTGYVLDLDSVHYIRSDKYYLKEQHRDCTLLVECEGAEVELKGTEEQIRECQRIILNRLDEVVQAKKEYDWTITRSTPIHVAFNKYKGRKKKLKIDDWKALFCAMLETDALREMQTCKGKKYHGIVMGHFVSKVTNPKDTGVCCSLVFCYDGYKRVVDEKEIVYLPIQK